MDTQTWLIGVLVALIAFAKFCPKEKICKMIDPFCKLVGVGLSTFLLLKFRKRIAEKIEEGFFCTLFDIIIYFGKNTKEYMLKDNK